MRKIEREQNTVGIMINFYCGKKHKRKSSLCEECGALLKYARERLENCPYGEEKKSCKKCITPCYAPEKKKRIRRVMGYSGPRMIYHKPLEWITHLFK